jgi:superfamily I DNA/RNA helicase
MALNEQQSAAVACDTHAVVIACPGSGKTRVLVERAVRLLATQKTARVVIVTFTRQAAAEIRRRLAARVPRERNRVEAQTFHALAIRHLLAAGLCRELVGPGTQAGLLRRAWVHAGEPIPWLDFVRAVETRASGQSVAHCDDGMEAAFDHYLALLEQHAAVDLSRSILHAVERIRSGHLAPLAATHLLVDEYQDADAAQVEWVLAHTERGAVLTAVGDDDQAIYGFRGSLGHGAVADTARRLEARSLALEVNYRSHSEIVGLGARLVQANRTRVPKTLRSARGPGGRVVLMPYPDADRELEDLAVTVASRPAEWAVIARSNAVLDTVERALTSTGVPYVRPGRSDFWQQEATSLLLALLERSPSPLTRGAALSLAGVSENDIQAVLAGRLSQATPQGRQAAASLDTLLSRAATASPPDAVAAVSDWLLARHPPHSSACRLLGSAAMTLKRLTGSLDDRLRFVRSPCTPEAERGLQLLTMHAAKGREFRRVWLPSLVDGVVPHLRATDTEEERRLLYVAMTRAEDELVLSFAWRRALSASGRSGSLQTPSRFLTIDLGITTARPASADDAALDPHQPAGATR